VCNFAPNGFHWADANTNYDLETALAMAPKLADAGVKGLESPLPPNLIRGYQSLKRRRNARAARRRGHTTDFDPTAT